MLRITADIYPGRPDPVAEITDEQEVRALLRELGQEPALRADADPAGRLGVRGFRIETLADDVLTDATDAPIGYPCAEVTRAALCDGMHRRLDCFP